MKWIKHDTDANQDAKLQNVLLDYGLEGYGLYWYCIELIAGKVDKECITFELEHDARIIARNTGSTPEKVERMMEYFVSLGLFECAGNTVTCMKLARRLDKSMTSNPDMRTIIEKLKNHDSVMTPSEKPMQEENRIEENRINNKRKSKQVTKATPLNYSNWPSMPNDELLQEWIERRKKMKLPVSQTVITMTGNQLVKIVQMGFSVEYAISEYITAGWKGLKAEYFEGKPKPHQQPQQQLTRSPIDNMNDVGWAKGIVEGRS